MEELNLKCYAHLGDAVYELFVREKVIYLTSSLSKMHKINTKLVRASFQCELLDILELDIDEKIFDLVHSNMALEVNV